MVTLLKFIIIAATIIVLGKIGIYYIVHASLFCTGRAVESSPADFGLVCEDVYFDSLNGTTLNGLFFPSDGARVTLVMFHGNAENVGDRLDYVKTLLGMKLNVFYFDYQGYGKSEGSPSEKRTYEDSLSAYNYLISRHDVDPDSIAFLGRSLGGALAIDLATKVKCYRLITDGTFSSVKDMAKARFPFLPTSIITPDKYNNTDKVSQLDAPTLIIHGTEDQVVPFAQSKILYNAANEPKEFYQVDGAGHNDTYLVENSRYFEKIETFLGLGAGNEQAAERPQE